MEGRCRKIIKGDVVEKYGIGTIHKTNEGYAFEVISKISTKNRLIRFLEGGYEKIVDTKSILTMQIKNPFHRSIEGIGYFGVGDYKGTDETGKSSAMYYSWRDMIRRCYVKSESNRNYVNVTVCDDWHNFQNFAKFYVDTKPSIKGIDFRLDKDLLQNGVENKVYSPSSVVWIPKEINSFLTNNQPRHNISGYIGVSENTGKKGYWRAQINDYDTGKYICIKYDCKSKEEAYELYKEYRAKNAEKVKVYLRSLNYLSEDIIQLIK